MDWAVTHPGTVSARSRRRYARNMQQLRRVLSCVLCVAGLAHCSHDSAQKPNDAAAVSGNGEAGHAGQSRDAGLGSAGQSAGSGGASGAAGKTQVGNPLDASVAGHAGDRAMQTAGADAASDAAAPDHDAGTSASGSSMIVAVSDCALRARSADGADFVMCRHEKTCPDENPDMLRAIAYGAGVFVAVGGANQTTLVMRSLDAVHWQEDLYPTKTCMDNAYPSSCKDWMGAVAYTDGIWLAGGGNGALMRSSDAGVSWNGVHPKTAPSPIRYMAAGSSRFVISSDGGNMGVSSDHGDTWTFQKLGQDPLRLAYGAGSFIAWASADSQTRVCYVSSDLGDHWNACPALIASSLSFVHDGARWVARVASGYATSSDAITWTMHTASNVPSELLFDGKTWFGASGTTLYRGANLDAFQATSVKVPSYRGWTAGLVLDSNLPVTGVPACTDAM
jgi:hypothetical protein